MSFQPSEQALQELIVTLRGSTNPSMDVQRQTQEVRSIEALLLSLYRSYRMFVLYALSLTAVRAILEPFTRISRLPGPYPDSMHHRGRYDPVGRWSNPEECHRQAFLA
jgi:hypothetical protein